jgi:hypothetical protein
MSSETHGNVPRPINYDKEGYVSAPETKTVSDIPSLKRLISF